MNELRKDPLLSRWVAVADYSMLPAEYETPSDNKNEGQCPMCSEGPEIASLRDEADGRRWFARVISSPRPVLENKEELGRKGVGMYDMMNSVGKSEIIVESPDHNLPAEDMGPGQFKKVITLYKMRLEELEKDPKIRYALIYKNSGKRAGAKHSHPHSEVMATPVIPKLVKGELDGAKQYYAYKERCIFCDIMAEEQRTRSRVITESADFMAFCPYAPKFPFEFWIMPKRHGCAFQEVTDAEMEDLSRVMTTLMKKMRRMLNEPPYNYFIHTAPNRIPRKDHWHTLGDDFHWHIEVIPRLGNTSGFEWGSDFYVLTTSPEDAANHMKEA